MRKPGSNERPDWQLAVVIGAGGLSVAVARRLSQRYRLLIVDIDAGRAADAAQMLCREGGDVSSFECDITSPDAVAKLASNIDEMAGFRVFVQVAGLSPSAGDFAEIIRVNLCGPALLADALLPRSHAKSVAIFTASLAAHNFTPEPALVECLRTPLNPDLVRDLSAILGVEQTTPAAAYQLSKFGLLMLARRSAAAWGKRGARILSISPGLIASPMGAREYRTSPSKRKLYERSPLGREGTLLEIADAVEFLASDRASFISGTDILVDGGLSGAVSDVPGAPLR